jgi:predicted secreted hydrolase
MRRRGFLSLPLMVWAGSAAAQYPRVVARRALAFPRDHGAHPEYRNEWWYVTGWLDGGHGFQVTFFRNRPAIAEQLASRFAPKQLLFAHAAIADPAVGRLVHDQRAAREGFDVARAGTGDTDVKIGDWTLVRSGDRYVTRIAARDFDLALEFQPTQPVLLQGDSGFSRKGPKPEQSSYYYSRPQLAVSGSVSRKAVKGTAWLDHEWSSEPLAPEAAGWDWVGLNGDDGSALMAFRIRGKDGRTVWAGGSERSADGKLTVFRPEDVRFEPIRTWKSPRTGVSYPVSMKVAAGTRELTLSPLMDDQEIDARSSTTTIYWEGAVKAAGFGKGYLELTGYWQPLKL